MKLSSINISHHKTAIGDLIVGSFAGKLCLLDFRHRKNRRMVDERIKRGLKVEFVEREDDVIRLAKRQVDEYLAGARREFDLPILTVGSDFQKQVWQALEAIDYGQTVSYQQLAEQIGKPRAVRAVASAVGANAIALALPCHRVIQTGGGLGGYAGGLAAKKKLLDMERE